MSLGRIRMCVNIADKDFNTPTLPWTMWFQSARAEILAGTISLLPVRDAIHEKGTSHHQKLG